MKRVGCTLALGILVGTALAENVDPDADGSQYAWAENFGWINAEPSGDGGPGLQVDDFTVSGYLWSENAGWISLSCANTGSCGVMPHGIVHAGDGVLSGLAWSENLGWIDFAPQHGGVTIDPATGEFAGRAWSENAGWISFAGDGEHPFGVKTAWTCTVGDAQATGLTLDLAGGATVLQWNGIDAVLHDVVRGSLSRLRSHVGDYAVATDACLADDSAATVLEDVDDPLPGEGAWFLVRARNCAGGGSYDANAPGQSGSRDAGIAASGQDCP